MKVAMYVGTGGPIAVSGLGALLDEDEEELPTRAQVKTGYREWLAVAPRDFPSDNMTADAAVGWGAQALDQYAASQGIDVRSSQHIDIRNVVATANQGRGFDTSSPQYAQYAEALGEMSAAVGMEVEYPGVAVELGVVTYETLKDGKLSSTDAERIGQVTGAIVGGIAAQAVGIPAPIGAMVGAAVGGGAGAITYAALGGGVDIKAKMKAAERAALANMERWRSEAVHACSGPQNLYWNELDSFYDSFAYAWAKGEQDVGWRFDLRWFDPNPGLAFKYTWDKKKLAPTESHRSDTLAVDYHCSTETVYHSGGRTQTGFCKQKCPVVYGCPYPYLGPGAVPARAVPDAFTGKATRVSQAFAARGIVWLPPNQRQTCEDYIDELPTGVNWSTNPQKKEKYQSDVNTQLWVLEQRLWELQRARAFLTVDMMRTHTAVRTERDMYVNRVSYLTDGWKRGAYEEAIQRSYRLSAVMNTTMLAAGAGLFGYGLYRAIR